MKVFEDKFDSKVFNKKVGKIYLNPDDDISLIKKLCYACENCDGALVQLATCIVCKRTVLRICVHCETVSNTGHICMKIATNRKCFEDLEIKN